MPLCNTQGGFLTKHEFNVITYNPAYIKTEGNKDFKQINTQLRILFLIYITKGHIQDYHFQLLWQTLSEELLLKTVTATLAGVAQWIERWPAN